LPLEVKLKTPFPGSKSTVPWKLPKVKILPSSLTTVELEVSKSDPPKDLAHSNV
jgi:hypothetical protein